MKAMLLAAATTALLTIGAARAADPAAPAAPASDSAPAAPLAACMRAGNARNWGLVDQQRLVVETRDGRYFDVELQDKCPASDRKMFLALLEDRHGLQDGRICGDLGDAVLPTGPYRDRLNDHPCRIASLRRIDKATFDQIFELEGDEARRMLDAAPTYQPEPREQQADQQLAAR